MGRPEPRAQRLELGVVENHSQISTLDLSKELEASAWRNFGIVASPCFPSTTLCAGVSTAEEDKYKDR